jgi:hypothetical protein
LKISQSAGPVLMLAATNFISKDVDVVSAKAMISFGVRLATQSCRLERTAQLL